MFKFKPSTAVQIKDLKICKTCRHFIPQSAGLCSLFGKIDPVTGEKTFFNARIIREYEPECGPEGRAHDAIDDELKNKACD